MTKEPTQMKSHLITFRDGMPLAGDVFIPEIGELLGNGIIARYGREEFERIILTHELHGHMGGYIVIGTKMGILAGEILNAPRNAMQIRSECWGTEFPLGCVNDGLLVATGCTPAHGNMDIDTRRSGYAARFTYNQATVRLQLKKAYQDELEEKISAAVEKYKIDGVLTQPYWDEVTRISLWIWEKWDRNEIFDIERDNG